MYIQYSRVVSNQERVIVVLVGYIMLIVNPPFKKLHNLTHINNYKDSNLDIENKVMIFL